MASSGIARTRHRRRWPRLPAHGVRRHWYAAGSRRCAEMLCRSRSGRTRLVNQGMEVHLRVEIHVGRRPLPWPWISACNRSLSSRRPRPDSLRRCRSEPRARRRRPACRSPPRRRGRCRAPSRRCDNDTATSAPSGEGTYQSIGRSTLRIDGARVDDDTLRRGITRAIDGDQPWLLLRGIPFEREASAAAHGDCAVVELSRVQLRQAAPYRLARRQGIQ